MPKALSRTSIARTDHEWSPVPGLAVAGAPVDLIHIEERCGNRRALVEFATGDRRLVDLDELQASHPAVPAARDRRDDGSAAAPPAG